MTINVEIDNSPPKKPNELKIRVIYAVLMAAGGIFATFAGGIAWALASSFVMGLIAFEWNKMCDMDSKYRWYLVILSALCGFVFALGNHDFVIFACVFFVTLLSSASYKSGFKGIIGSAILALCGFSFSSLRLVPEYGIFYIMALFAIVWVTDSSAYAFGRWIKGPKLMPNISPNKTWSGSIGGLLAGTLAGGTYSIIANIFINPENIFKTFFVWLLVGAILSLSCQIGDMLESLAKRHFGVKDTSQLIPGHGGILDRLDGHLFVALVLFIMSLIPAISSKLV